MFENLKKCTWNRCFVMKYTSLENFGIFPCFISKPVKGRQVLLLDLQSSNYFSFDFFFFFLFACGSNLSVVPDGSATGF